LPFYTLPEYLYPRDPLLLVSALLLAQLLDLVYPYHSGILLKIHPVHTSYIMALKLGKPYSSKIRGAVVWFTVVGIHLAAYSALLYVCWSVSKALWVLASAYVMKQSFSLKLLIDIVLNAAHCAERGDWGCARGWVQQIVRRDVYKLDEEHVVSAAIESLAESLVDGYTSPLLYIALLGPIGGLLQRVANTLDGALGFKTPEYRDVGWFSAKMDTVLNFIPARLTALTIVLFSPLAGGRIGYAFSVWRRYRRATESLNAGHPMSAMAGALRVRLEKPGHYTLGEPLERLAPSKIRDGVKLALASAALWFAAVVLAIAEGFMLIV